MSRKPVDDIPSTPHFDFLFGSYRLSSWHIPYFSTHMRLDEAAEFLSLATDFPGAEDIKWKVDELYQRDIDWTRVERRILPYLQAKDRPQFFNSITIALLPMPEKGVLGYSFSEDKKWENPGLFKEKRFEKVLKVGPIAIGYWNDWTSLTERTAATGQLRWNHKKVFGVAIDGQHRLAGIQGMSPANAETSQVPVILLLLDKKLGFKPPVERPIVEVLRVLFIDLNKHAKVVRRARQILLDDRDPISICVRGVTGDALTSGFDDLKSSPPRIPLTLVDWHSEQAKFDDGPYLTTILGLDWIATKLLDTKPISDYTDYGAIRNQIKALQRNLSIDLQEAAERLRGCKNLTRAFAYTESDDNGELSIIRSSFEELWASQVVRLLSEFKPYQELIGQRLKGKADTIAFANWYALYYKKNQAKYEGKAQEDYNRFVGRLSQRRKDPIGENELVEALDEINDLKKKWGLAFNVAFQRAYFLAYKEFQKISAVHIEELQPYWEEEEEEEDFDDFEYEEEEEGEEGEEEEEEEFEWDAESRVDRFVGALNTLLENEPHFLDVDFQYETSDGSKESFWKGSLLKPEGNIDFTQGASKRASDIIFWIAAMAVYDERTEPETESDFEAFEGLLEAGEGKLLGRIRRAVKRFTDKEGSAAGRILEARDQVFSNKKSKKEAIERMRWIWKTLEL